MSGGGPCSVRYRPRLVSAPVWTRTARAGAGGASGARARSLAGRTMAQRASAARLCATACRAESTVARLFTHAMAFRAQRQCSTADRVRHVGSRRRSQMHSRRCTAAASLRRRGPRRARQKGDAQRRVRFRGSGSASWCSKALPARAESTQRALMSQAVARPRRRGLRASARARVAPLHDAVRSCVCSRPARSALGAAPRLAPWGAVAWRDRVTGARQTGPWAARDDR